MFVAFCGILFVTIIRRYLKCAIPAFYKTNETVKHSQVMFMFIHQSDTAVSVSFLVASFVIFS